MNERQQNHRLRTGTATEAGISATGGGLNTFYCRQTFELDQKVSQRETWHTDINSI